MSAQLATTDNERKSRPQSAHLSAKAKRATAAAMADAGKMSKEEADKAAMDLLGFDLSEAAARDDIQSLRRICSEADLRMGKEKVLNWKSPSSSDGMSGHTALHMAAQAGNIEAARFIISEGANLDQQSNEGFTPLMRACDAGMPEMCELLLSSGANPELEAKTA
eukprot:g2537.t1